jgi:hypothetical protein
MSLGTHLKSSASGRPQDEPGGAPSRQKRGSIFSAVPTTLTGALIFFLLLWLWDFPKPMCDDLFYCGAGLNLAHGGDLSNPLLLRQHFPGHLFLIYPPVHSFVLAGWLKIFGISSASMTGFQLLMYFVTAAATIAFLRSQAAVPWLKWLVPIGVAAAFLPFGLRPEPLAAALIMAGFALAEDCGPNDFFLFPGFFLMALGAATAPRTAFFGAALMAVAGYDRWILARGTGRSFSKSVAIGLAGVMAAAFLFCLMLDFRLAEFWAAFEYYSRLVAGNKLELLRVFFTRYVGVTQWAVFPLFLWLLAYSFCAPSQALKRVGMSIAATFPLVMLIGGLGDGTMWFIFLGMFALTATVLKLPKSEFTRSAIPALLVAILVLANARPLVNVAGILTGNIRARPGDRRSEALAMRSTAEHPVLVDEFVARYAFDYRIPAGFLYWPFSAPFPAERAIDVAIRPEDVYLLGPLNVDTLNQKHFTNLPQPVWGMGLRRWSFYREPCQVYIIPAKDLGAAGGRK